MNITTDTFVRTISDNIARAINRSGHDLDMVAISTGVDVTTLEACRRMVDPPVFTVTQMGALAVALGIDLSQIINHEAPPAWPASPDLAEPDSLGLDYRNGPTFAWTAPSGISTLAELDWCEGEGYLVHVNAHRSDRSASVSINSLSIGDAQALHSMLGKLIDEYRAASTNDSDGAEHEPEPSPVDEPFECPLHWCAAEAEAHDTESPLIGEHMFPAFTDTPFGDIEVIQKYERSPHGTTVRHPATVSYSLYTTPGETPGDGRILAKALDLAAAIADGINAGDWDSL